MVHDTRQLNRSAVLTHLMLNRPASRKQIARASGISAATVTRAVDQLIEQGLVEEVSELVSDQRGRRPVLLDVRAEHAIVAGVDLGASSTRILITDFRGRVRNTTESATATHLDSSGLAEWLVAAVIGCASSAWASIETVRIGLPGAVGRNGTTISNAPNLPQIESPDFLGTLTAKLARPVIVDNDANFALLGEQHFGAAHQSPTAVMITLGAGLGSAIAIDGKILRGNRGLIGEFGQIPAGPLGTRLEHAVTGPGILRNAAQVGIPISSPAEIFAPDAPRGLAGIRAHFDDALLVVLTAAMVSCEPDVIVLGGGIAKSLGPDLPRYQQALLQNLGAAPAIVNAALGDFAGATGAAVSALHDVYRQLGVDDVSFANIPSSTWL